MGADPREDAGPFDAAAFRLPGDPFAGLAERTRPPRHRPGEPFLRGPIPFAWIAAACRLPGSGLHVATAYRFLCGRYGGPNRWGLDMLARGLLLSRDTARRGLHAAELAGLLVVEREPGCKLAVSIRELPEPEGRRKRRPLYGPIPWAWWLAAMRLPGPTLHAAVACWLLAGWERSAEFSLALESWADLGLSRDSGRRGLGQLSRAGLVELGPRRKGSLRVRLLPSPARSAGLT
jgi:hypothetical protein